MRTFNILKPCWDRANLDFLETGGPGGSKAWRGLQVTRAGKVTQEPKDKQCVYTNINHVYGAIVCECCDNVIFIVILAHV